MQSSHVGCADILAVAHLSFLGADGDLAKARGQGGNRVQGTNREGLYKGNERNLLCASSEVRKRIVRAGNVIHPYYIVVIR